MDRNEMTNTINQLLTMVAADHQATASEMLTTLREGYEETLTNYETASADLLKANQNVEHLRAVNTKLFLKVGEQEKDINQPNQPQKDIEQPEPPALTYEALFNEKGELK